MTYEARKGQLLLGVTAPSSPASPGRPGLSYETYEKAYFELSAPDGTPPSQRQLRKYLGTGSNTTLANYRRRIAEARQEDQLPPEPNSIDAELLETVQRLARQIALDEAQVADDRVDAIQVDADNRIRIAETTMQKRLEDTAVLEHRADSAENTVLTLRAALSEQDAKLAAANSALQSGRESVAALTQTTENNSQQLAEKNAQIIALQKTLDQTQKEHKSDLEKYRSEHSAVSDELSEAKSTLASVTEQRESLTARLNDRDEAIEKQASLYKEIEESLSETCATLQALCESLTQEVTALNIQLSTATSSLASEKNHTN